MQHLDEGMIHAWLDGALSADEAARVERHATECADCAAVVAEARGLVAGASRVLSALDDIPVVVPFGLGGRGAAGGVSTLPRAAVRPAPSARRPRWWSRPAALAAAAGVVLMAGSAIVLNKSGGRDSLGAGFGDDAPPRGATTEERVPLAGVQAAAPGGAVQESARGDGGAGAAATSSRVAAPVPPPGPPRQGAAVSREVEGLAAGSRATASGSAGGRVANAAGRASGATLEPVVPTAVASGAAQKAAAGSPKEPTRNERVTLAPAAPTVAAPAPAADVAVQQRAMAPERAEARRAGAARARSERVLEADAAEPGAAVRVDTVYMRGRIDTVIVDPPDSRLFLRQPGGAVGSVKPVYPVTGCYQIVQGGLRGDTLTLSKTRAWSGRAEARFRATTSGASGFWSQPPNGEIHIMIGGALVNARIDPSGDLRGRVRRGGPSEPFLARRCR